MSKKRLVFHIGHPKTGSSYIQSLFANNTALLRSKGINYPELGAIERARSGGVTLGNVRAQDFKNKEFFARHLKGFDTLILSNETLFSKFADETKLIDNASHHFDKIEIVMLLRDPYDFIRSYYIQRVKTCDFNGSLDEYIQLNEFGLPHLERVERIIKKCASEGYSLRTFQYHNSDSLLKKIIAEVTGVSGFLFTDPPLSKINRSLTEGELYLQRRLNLRLSEKKLAYWLFAYELVTRVPEIETRLPEASPDIQRKFHEITLPKLQSINSLLPALEAYALKQQPSAKPSAEISPDHYTFTKSQLDLLADIISNEILSGKHRKRPLKEFAKRIREKSRSLRSRLLR